MALKVRRVTLAGGGQVCPKTFGHGQILAESPPQILPKMFGQPANPRAYFLGSSKTRRHQPYPTRSYRCSPPQRVL